MLWQKLLVSLLIGFIAIVNGTRRVTADTDLRLCRFFGLSEGYFLRLQNAYELMEAKRNLGKVLIEIKPYASPTF